MTYKEALDFFNKCLDDKHNWADTTQMAMRVAIECIKEKMEREKGKGAKVC